MVTLRTGASLISLTRSDPGPCGTLESFEIIMIASTARSRDACDNNRILRYQANHCIENRSSMQDCSIVLAYSIDQGTPRRVVLRCVALHCQYHNTTIPCSSPTLYTYSVVIQRCLEMMIPIHANGEAAIGLLESLWPRLRWSVGGTNKPLRHADLVCKKRSSSSPNCFRWIDLDMPRSCDSTIS